MLSAHSQKTIEAVEVFFLFYSMLRSIIPANCNVLFCITRLVLPLACTKSNRFSFLLLLQFAISIYQCIAIFFAARPSNPNLFLLWLLLENLNIMWLLLAVCCRVHIQSQCVASKVQCVLSLSSARAQRAHRIERKRYKHWPRIAGVNAWLGKIVAHTHTTKWKL